MSDFPGRARSISVPPSRSKGAVSRNVLNLISQRPTEAVDASFADRYGMHHGKLDVKFRDVDSLRAVSDFEIIEIIEINGAGLESMHV